MIKAGIYGKGYHNLSIAIKRRESFTTSGAFSAFSNPHSGIVTSGQLNDYERSFFDAARMVGFKYVIYSYDTPIYWETVDGGRHTVEQKFSVTTSRHQGLLYLLDM